jgi:purine-binding chemotaxis protein CheW
MSISSIKETKQYLTFRIGDEDFALDVANVREILEFTTVTKVPKTPDYMRGVINLRGSVVPVLDMRLKFGLSETKRTINTCVIVIEVSIENTKTVMGAMVDCVQEVFELEPDEIELPPRIGTMLKTEFIKGMGRKDDHFIILLDIDKLFSSDELVSAGKAQDDELMNLASNA